MLDTNKQIGRILGNGKGLGNDMPRQHAGFGQGRGPGRGMTNFNVNPREVMAEIQKLLSKLPSVKKANGNIDIVFSDGNKGSFKINYN